MPESRNPAEELAAEYSERAVIYERCWAPVIGPMARRLFGSLRITDAERVLDLGCGTGHLLPDVRAAAPGAVVLGVDYAAGMLRRASRKNVCPLAVMDARRLAFPDRTFDAVILSFVLFHVADPPAALREIERVLRLAGNAGLAVWAQADPDPWDVIWREELDAAGAAPDPRNPVLMQHALMDTEEKLAGLLASAGLEPTRLWAETFEHPWDADDLFDLQANCGLQLRRLLTLPESKRSACRDRVRKRLGELSRDELVLRPRVIFAVVRPAAG